MEKAKLPISEKNLIRLLVLLCVVLALLGGYYHAQRKTLQRRYDTLYQKYNTLLDDYAAEVDKNGMHFSEPTNTLEVQPPASPGMEPK